MKPGELRCSLEGNVYRLAGTSGEHVYVQRVSNGTDGLLWDAGETYYWHVSSWLLLTPTEG